jgi:hypothetical protein
MSATDLPGNPATPTAGTTSPAPGKGVEPDVLDSEEGPLPRQSDAGEPSSGPPLAPPNPGNIQPQAGDNSNTTNVQEEVGDHPNPAPFCEGPSSAIPKRSLTEIGL